MDYIRIFLMSESLQLLMYLMPPSREGGGKTEGFDGGREKPSCKALPFLKLPLSQPIS